MEWHITDAQSLSSIDKEIGGFLASMHSPENASKNDDTHFSPAEYEIIRRVIYATGDFEYKSIIEFSDRALQASAAALASRSTVVVDNPKVQVGIAQTVQNTFANPVYCAVEAQTRPQQGKTRAAWGMETLVKRYPEGIFVVGQAATALISLMELIEAEKIRPVLIIATPPQFINIDGIKKSLKEFSIPNITIKSRKGGATVAAAILDGLIDLAWEAYG
ncbi:precorrin isomerase [Rivularia sp. PCC 7116]|uniref:precorrin-8X methylmutase n=1 Tax=Rivularia sp. PCC 7116 TaxID=373994 RepID=UPI00029F39CE|nr:precorrin-8X methylmutase [Rivularia sp. PCC 7116]AFY59031.1 precorrin isomerase [Rivularia sp. PCC 7116]